MKLSIKDRLIIPALYPVEADLVTQVLIRDLKGKLDFKQEELKAIEFKVTETGYTWDKTKEVENNIALTAAEISLLTDAVKLLIKEQKVTQDNLDLVEKIQKGEVEEKIEEPVKTEEPTE